MNFKIEKIEKCRVAYMRQVGSYGSGNHLVMHNLKKWAEEKNLFNEGSIIYGITQDNPQITPPQNCRYDVCIAISDDYQADAAVNVTEMMGGDYAVYKVQHTAKAIQEAWTHILGDLKDQGYQIEHKPVIERYKKEMIDQHYCEICVPVKVL